MLRYTSDKGYHYAQQRNGSIKRVSKADSQKAPLMQKPRIGEKVKIIIKPYHEKNYIIGVVARVLTKKKHHPRGHKVKLTTGVVGRIVYIFGKK
jgi:uncharacterized repeat protein (TIGR03833 family)